MTRLATAASLQPVLTSVSAIAAPARKFSPALRGIAIGAAAAVIVAGLVVLLLVLRTANLVLPCVNAGCFLAGIVVGIVREFLRLGSWFAVLAWVLVSAAIAAGFLV